MQTHPSPPAYYIRAMHCTALHTHRREIYYTDRIVLCAGTKKTLDVKLCIICTQFMYKCTDNMHKY